MTFLSKIEIGFFRNNNHTIFFLNKRFSLKINSSNFNNLNPNKINNNNESSINYNRNINITLSKY